MIKTQIVPAILTTSAEQFKASLTSYSAFAERIQIDITDGTFAPYPTIELSKIAWTAGPEIDLHMMVARPSEFMPTILQLKPALVIFHAEATEDLLPIFAQLKNAGIKTGVAFMKSTFPGKYKQYIEAADHAMIFGGELGRQGSSADMLQVEKVAIIREIKSTIEIGWDGGANMNNVRAIAHADFDIINVGSALANASDQAATFKELTDEMDRRGVVLP